MGDKPKSNDKTSVPERPPKVSKVSSANTTSLPSKQAIVDALTKNTKSKVTPVVPNSKSKSKSKKSPSVSPALPLPKFAQYKAKVSSTNKTSLPSKQAIVDALTMNTKSKVTPVVPNSKSKSKGIVSPHVVKTAKLQTKEKENKSKYKMKPQSVPLKISQNPHHSPPAKGHLPAKEGQFTLDSIIGSKIDHRPKEKFTDLDGKTLNYFTTETQIDHKFLPTQSNSKSTNSTSLTFSFDDDIDEYGMSAKGSYWANTSLNSSTNGIEKQIKAKLHKYKQSSQNNGTDNVASLGKCSTVKSKLAGGPQDLHNSTQPQSSRTVKIQSSMPTLNTPESVKPPFENITVQDSSEKVERKDSYGPLSASTGTNHEQTCVLLPLDSYVETFRIYGEEEEKSFPSRSRQQSDNASLEQFDKHLKFYHHQANHFRSLLQASHSNVANSSKPNIIESEDELIAQQEQLMRQEEDYLRNMSLKQRAIDYGNRVQSVPVASSIGPMFSGLSSLFNSFAFGLAAVICVFFLVKLVNTIWG